MGTALVASTAGDIVGAVATVVVAVVTVVGGYYTQRSIARQTLDEPKTPRRGRKTPSTRPAPARALDQQRSREVEGFIVRFIILYLFVQAWSALLNVTNPFIYLSVNGRYVSFVVGGVYALIFFLLGLPLLLDILRRYGIRAGGLAHSDD